MNSVPQQGAPPNLERPWKEPYITDLPVTDVSQLIRCASAFQLFEWGARQLSQTSYSTARPRRMQRCWE